MGIPNVATGQSMKNLLVLFSKDLTEIIYSENVKNLLSASFNGII